MDFNLTEEQEMIRKMARDFLVQNCPKSFLREMEQDEKGYSPALWEQMAGLGWMGLALPEKYSGGGGNFLDIAILLEEMGRALLPGPFFSTVVLGALLILEAGSERQKQEILTGIARGKTLLTLALSERETQFNHAHMTTKATAIGQDFLIEGRKFLVPDAHVADFIICAARTGRSCSLFLVDGKAPGLQCNLADTVTHGKWFEVVFDKVKVPRENLLGSLNEGSTHIEKLLPVAMVAQSMSMLGGMQQVLEMATQHAKTRVQFSRVIGTFQAIQHHCANILVDVNTSRYLIYRTAWMISQGIPCRKDCYMTKAYVNDAYQRVVRLGAQVHGGAGIMQEYDMQFYFRRARQDEVVLGDTDYCRENVASLLPL